jgi:hypothetical protein
VRENSKQHQWISCLIIYDEASLKVILNAGVVILNRELLLSVQNDNTRKFLSVPRSSGELTNYFVGWKEGAGQAEQVYMQQNLDLVEDLGRAAGFTSRRPPRDYAWVSAWRDRSEAKLHGEVFRRFISGCLQTGVDRRRIKRGVNPIVIYTLFC